MVEKIDIPKTLANVRATWQQLAAQVEDKSDLQVSPLAIEAHLALLHFEMDAANRGRSKSDVIEAGTGICAVFLSNLTCALEDYDDRHKLIHLMLVNISRTMHDSLDQTVPISFVEMAHVEVGDA